MPGRDYTPQQRANAVRAVFADHDGNIQAAAEALGIPKRTLTTWVNEARARGEAPERTKQPLFANEDGTEATIDEAMFERPVKGGPPIGKGQPEHERLTLAIEAMIDGMTAGGDTKIGKSTLAQLALAVGKLIEARRQIMMDVFPDEDKITETIHEFVTDRDTLAKIGARLDEIFAPVRAVGSGRR